MAAVQSVPSEVEKSEEEDPVKEVIRWVVKALLQEEERALVSDMLEYRNNLSLMLPTIHLITAFKEDDDEGSEEDYVFTVSKRTTKRGKKSKVSPWNPTGRDDCLGRPNTLSRCLTTVAKY